MGVIAESSRRCRWCGDAHLYVRYHDEEWGRLASTDDRALFELLTLESAQAGLSWITILRRREAYRRVFFDFDFRRVAMMTDADEERLLADSSIVRNRRKIHSAIANAGLFAAIVDEFGSFHKYVIRFLPGGKRMVNDVPDETAVAASSAVSDAMSADMRRRGFRFFGTVICHSFLQAAGYVDDHVNGCPFKSRP